MKVKVVGSVFIEQSATKFILTFFTPRQAGDFVTDSHGEFWDSFCEKS